MRTSQLACFASLLLVALPLAAAVYDESDTYLVGGPATACFRSETQSREPCPPDIVANVVLEWMTPPPAQLQVGVAYTAVWRVVAPAAYVASHRLTHSNLHVCATSQLSTCTPWSSDLGTTTPSIRNARFNEAHEAQQLSGPASTTQQVIIAHIAIDETWDLAIGVTRLPQVAETVTRVNAGSCVLSALRSSGASGQLSFTTSDGVPGSSISLSFASPSDGSYFLRIADWGVQPAASSDSASALASAGGLFRGVVSRTACDGSAGAAAVPSGDSACSYVGYVAGGSTFDVVAGSAASVFADDVISLSGVNSVLGRTVIVFAGSSDADGQPVAACTIGRAGEGGSAVDWPAYGDAAVQLVGTAGHEAVSGFVRLSSLPAGGMRVSWLIAGLTPMGQHGWHIHVSGDVSSSDGSAVGPHFVGSGVARPSPPCVAACNEVAQIGGTGVITADSSGRAVGSLSDAFLSMNGENAIVGRSIIIHASGTADRIAQGVIALAPQKPLVVPPRDGGQAAASEQQVTAAVCNLTPAAAGGSGSGGGAATIGSFALQLTESGDTVVSWRVAGLPPAQPLAFSVRSYGDVLDVTGGGTGSLFVGRTPISRPAARCDSHCNAVGSIGGGQQPLLANAAGVATGRLLDGFLPLNGDNSVLGRSIAISSTSSIDGPPLATCVIARALDGDRVAAYDAAQPAAAEAACLFRPTAADSEQQPLSGFVRMRQRADGLQISWYVRGLVDGEHAWHIHSWGDTLGQRSAAYVGGHWLGVDGDVDRPQPPCTTLCHELSNIGDTGSITAVNGVSSGRVVDSLLTLTGRNGIIGRGIVIHGDGVSPAARVAQCAIGASAFVSESPVSAACATLDCGSRGSCVDGVCFCRDGYSGLTCGTPPPASCVGVDCGAHGSCSVGSCFCSDSWTGDSCDTPPAAVDGDTSNGDGDGNNNGSGIVSHEQTYLGLVAGIIIGLVVGGLIAFIVLINCRRSSTTAYGSSSGSSGSSSGGRAATGGKRGSIIGHELPSRRLSAMATSVTRSPLTGSAARPPATLSRSATESFISRSGGGRGELPFHSGSSMAAADSNDRKKKPLADVTMESLPPTAPSAVSAVSAASAGGGSGGSGAVKLRAKYAKKPDGSVRGELELHKGDIITLVEKSDSGWWTGILDGVEGVFPHNYVEEV